MPDPKNQKGSWHSLFAAHCAELSGDTEASQSMETKPLYLEIGSGKGLFITEMAKVHPDRLYLACEGAVNIYPRILQKAGTMELSNLMLINEYIVHPADYFALGELAGVYLNFSDPWPKKRDAHRRLTYAGKLLQYKEIMPLGSTLEFKTDNDELFNFSLEQVGLAGLKADYVTRDLHASPLAETNVETEYEQKFAALGKTINYLRIVF